MLTFVTILRFLGFIRWAYTIEQAFIAKRKAQNVANVPTTKQEWTDAADKGDL